MGVRFDIFFCCQCPMVVECIFFYTIDLIHAAETLCVQNSRSPRECQMRWENVLSNRINKGPWSKEEEVQLRALARKHRNHNWTVIAKELKVITGLSLTTSVCV